MDRIKSGNVYNIPHKETIKNRRAGIIFIYCKIDSTFSYESKQETSDTIANKINNEI